jgi:hypothetical protein
MVGVWIDPVIAQEIILLDADTAIFHSSLFTLP